MTNIRTAERLVSLDAVFANWHQLQKSKCEYDPKAKLDVVVKEPKRIKTGADKDLAIAIYNYGPVAIAIHVTQDLTHYKWANQFRNQE